MTSITRARAVIIHDGQILLMQRIKDGVEYYTLCGGKVDPGETPKQACVREIYEEASIRVRIDKEIFRFQSIYEGIPNSHFIFNCTYLSGIPALNGEEIHRFTLQNRYKPMWVAMENLASLPIKPDWLQDFLYTI